MDSLPAPAPTGVVCALLAALACASPPAVIAPTPEPVDLTGVWTSGAGAGPAEGVVRVERPCGSTVRRWLLVHRPGHRLSGQLLDAGPLEGLPRPLPVIESFDGAAPTPDALALRGAAQGVAVEHRLRLDRDGLLRGTRDGVPVWFAPLRIDAPAGCVDALTTPAPFDLSDSWLTGDEGNEPAPTEIVLHTDCANHPAAWVLRQEGDRLEAWDFAASFDQGIVRAQPVARIAPDLGRVVGVDVTIGDGHRLRFDPESGHLRGTRDGRPFWAVRQRVVRPGQCPGIP